MEPSRFTRTRRRATLASLISALALLSPSTLTRSRTAHSLCGLPAPRGAGPHLRRTQMMKILKHPASLLILAAGLVFLGGASSPALAGKTLDAVRQRGEISCGVSTGIGGFS